MPEASVEEAATELERGVRDVRRKLRELGLGVSAEGTAGTGGLDRTAADRIALMLLVAVATVMPFAMTTAVLDGFGLPKTILWQAGIAGVVLVGAWAARRGGPVALPRAALCVGPVLFLLLTLPGTALATNRALALGRLRFWSFGLLTYLAARAALRSGPRQRLLFRCFTVALALQAVYAVLQYFGLDPGFRFSEAQRMRVFGTIGNPNFLGGYLAGGLPLALGLALWDERRAWRTVGFVSVLLCAAALVVTGSKGGLLSAAAGGTLLLCYAWFRGEFRARLGAAGRKALLGAGIALLLFVGAAAVFEGAFPIWRNLVTSLDPKGKSVGIRRVYWHTTVELIKARPVAGWGPGCFAAHQLEAQADWLARPENATFVHTAGTPRHAHNDYLQLTAEAGLLGLAGLLIMLALWMSQAMLHLRRDRPDWAACAAAAVAAILVQALVSFPLYRPLGCMMFWLFSAVALPAHGAASTRRVHVRPWLGAVACAAAAVLLLSVCWQSVRLLAAERHGKTGKGLAMAGQWERALPAFDKALAMNPHHAELMMNRGLACFHTGQFRAAIDTLLRSCRYERHVQTHTVLGDAYARLGQTSEAEEEYARAMRLGPANTAPRFAYATFLKDSGRAVEARQEWQTVLELEPQNARALANLAAAAFNAGEHDQARELATRLLRSNDATAKHRELANKILAQ